MAGDPDRPSPLKPESLLEQMSWVHSLARSIVGDDRADDLAQETLLAAVESPPQQLPVPGARGWLATVLRNRAVSVFRSDERRKKREEIVARSERVQSDDDVLERAELQQSLVNAVMDLRDPYRTVLLLRYFEGQSPLEIARRRQTTAATIRSQQKRALELLRESLDQKFDGRRGWHTGLVAFVNFPPQGVASAGGAAAVTTTKVSTAGTVSGLAVGGVIMTLKSFAVSVVIGAALVGSALYWMNESGPQFDRGVSSTSDSQSESTSDDGVGTKSPHSPIADTTTPVVSSDAAAPVAVVSLGRIEGVVTDEEGRSLEGIVLHAIKGEAAGPKLTTAGGEAIQVLSMAMTTFAQSVPDFDETVGRAVTDVDGGYSIADLEPGTYAVVARGKGYQQQLLPEIEVEASSETRANLVLQIGQFIDGIVLDPDGNPVPGARVTANSGIMQFAGGSLSIGSNRGKPNQGVIVATSDDGGRFRLEGLASGTYNINAAHEAFAPGLLGNVAAGSSQVEVRLRVGFSMSGVVRAPTGDPMAGVAVRTGGFGVFNEETTTDAEGRYSFSRMAPRSLHVVAECDAYPRVKSERFRAEDGDTYDGFDLQFEDGAVITGQVVDFEGVAISGVRVRVEPAGRRSMGFSFWGNDDSKASTTGDDGRFQLGGLEMGRAYRVAVKHPEFLSEELEIETAAGSTDVGTIELRPGATIRGVVVDDRTGEPLVGISVRLVSNDSGGEAIMMTSMGGAVESVGGGSPKLSTTDDEGRFELTAIDVGDYWLRAKSVGYAPHKSEVLTVSDSTDMVRDIRMGAGLSIAGTVLDGDSRPVPGATISVQRFHAGEFVQASAKADADGRFRLAGVGAGAYSLTARFGSMAPTTLAGVEAGDQLVVVTLLSRGGITGRVFDVATNGPITDFSVKMSKSAEGAGAIGFDLSSMGEGAKFKDPDGRFTMKDLDPGEYTLTVKADGFVRYRSDVTIAPDSSIDVQIPMDIGGAVDGYVRDHDGKPIEGARVRQVVEDGDSQNLVAVSFAGEGGEGGVMTSFSPGRRAPTAMTDANGYYVLSGLPAGEVDLEYHDSKFIDRTVEKVRVLRAQTRRLEPVLLERGGGVKGRVQNAAGEPLVSGGLFIEGLNADGESTGKPTMIGLDDQGRFEQLGLASGSYRLSANDWSAAATEGGNEPATKVVVVQLDPDEIETVNIRFE